MKHRFKIAGSLIGGLIIAPFCSIQWLLTGRNLGLELWDYTDQELQKLKKINETRNRNVRILGKLLN